MSQALDLLAERLDVLKAAIHRGEAHVGHLVEMAQFLHDELTNGARRHLALAEHTQIVADAPDRLLDRLGTDWALLEGFGHALLELVLVKWLAAAVALDHTRHQQFCRLEGREALTAAKALAPPTDLAAVSRQPRVRDFGLDMATKGTMHLGARLSIRPEPRSVQFP